MNNRDKSALALALAIVGGIAAGMRCDASVTVENSSQYTPRPATYTVKAYTEGSDPFDANLHPLIGLGPTMIRGARRCLVLAAAGADGGAEICVLFNPATCGRLRADAKGDVWL